MIESFVDLTYRGLSLGRRVKLTQVRPTTGYLEVAAPMPVGTRVAFATDEGVVVDAVVAEIREQTAGSERVPGMKIVPGLGPEAASAWWQARVALADEEPPPPPRVMTPVTVRRRADTLVEAPPIAAVAAVDDVPDGLDTSAESSPEHEPEIRISEPAIPRLIEPRAEAMNSKRTTVMSAVDQDLLKSLTQHPGEIEKLVERTGDHPVIDDGKRTMVMEAIDPSALGLEGLGSGASGAMPASDGDDGDGRPSSSGRKRRPKKR